MNQISFCNFHQSMVQMTHGEAAEQRGVGRPSALRPLAVFRVSPRRRAEDSPPPQRTFARFAVSTRERLPGSNSVGGA